MSHALGLLGTASVLISVGAVAAGLVSFTSHQPRSRFVILCGVASFAALLAMVQSLVAIQGVNSAVGILPPEIIAEGRRGVWTPMWAGLLAAIPAFAVGLSGMFAPKVDADV